MLLSISCLLLYSLNYTKVGTREANLIEENLIDH